MSRGPQIPPLGVSLACRVVGVVDGDTVEVEIVRRCRVRLLDCWAPESRTTDAAEKKAGIAAKLNLTAIAKDKPATLFIPTEGADRVGDVFTFDRVLGQLWIKGDDRSLSYRQVAANHASTVKGGTVGS